MVSNGFRDSLKYLKTQAVISSTTSRSKNIRYDKEIHKERNVVERFFARIKQFLRIATRYDKTTKIFYASLMMASIIIWLKL